MKLDVALPFALLLSLAACSSNEKPTAGSSAAASASVAAKTAPSAAASGTTSSSLGGREEELFKRFMVVVEENPKKCSALADASHELISREAATVSEIQAAYARMSPDEKKAKKDADNARAAHYEVQGVTIGVCTLESSDFKRDYEALVPSTK